MPRVQKQVLIFIAGLLWISVGLFLIKLSTDWFSGLTIMQNIIIVFGTFLLGTLISYFGFSKLADKNIERINLYEIFAFT